MKETELVQKALEILGRPATGQAHVEVSKSENEIEAAEQAKVHNAQAREELDQYFSQETLPKLSELHQAGKLPDLANDPLWVQVEAAWDKAAVGSKIVCDVAAVKKAMLQAIETFGKHEEG